MRAAAVVLVIALVVAGAVAMGSLLQWRHNTELGTAYICGRVYEMEQVRPLQQPEREWCARYRQLSEERR